MDDWKRELIGSPSRDAFKHWHKQECRNCYAGDLDLVLIEKKSRKEGEEIVKSSGIVALIDFKTRTEPITFVEIIIYNEAIVRWAIPVYIVRTEIEFKNYKATFIDESGIDCEFTHRIVNLNKSFKKFTIERYLGGDWRPMPEQFEIETILTDIDEKTYWDWEKALRNATQLIDFEYPKYEIKEDPYIQQEAAIKAAAEGFNR